VRTQIAAAVDLIVHVARLSDGRRKVTRISELAGFGSEGPVVRDIFLLETRPDGALQVRATGVIPKSLEKVRMHGVALPSDMLRKIRPTVVAQTA
jgi:pilus assembly protein CpaF